MRVLKAFAFNYAVTGTVSAAAATVTLSLRDTPLPLERLGWFALGWAAFILAVSVAQVALEEVKC